MPPSPLFWSAPLKYCSWAARERPALFWSVIIGGAGPLLMPIVPPIRHYFGDIDPAPVPVTYPGAFFSSTRAVCPAPMGSSSPASILFLSRETPVEANYLCPHIVPNGARKQLTGYDD